MSRSASRILFAATLALSLVACAAPSGSPRSSGQPAAQSTSSTPQRTLVLAYRTEAASITSRPFVQVDGPSRGPIPIFNATLDGLDERGIGYPYLAEAIPQLNTDTWTVSPDGRMETRYKLRPNLTWHDGTPLSSEDFVFGWRVYATPALGQASSPPIVFMEEVLAPDAQTIVIRWRQPYGEAASLSDEFQPLPRHLLQQPFQELDPSAFVNLPFWSVDYVGLGAYKVERWEPGTFIDARAFDGFVLGKPKIDRLKIAFISDANTALANILAGEVHAVGEFLFGDEQAATLESQWASTQGGTILYAQTVLRVTLAQFRPEYASPAAQLDVRVRRALAHAIDADTANEVLNRGRGLVTSTVTSPNVDFYPEIARVASKHPFNPARAQQTMDGAGFSRGSDGFYRAPDGSAMDFGVWFTSSAKNQQENAVIVDSLRKAGFDASNRVFPSAQTGDGEAMALIAGLQTRGHNKPLLDYTTEQIARPENRWRGSNRGAWSNAAYDRALEAFSVSLERSERIRHIAEMERIFTDELPAIPHWFSPNVTAHVASLKGPVARINPMTTGGTLKIHEWEWRV